MVRKAELKDLEFIFEIVISSIKYLKDNNIDQWQNGYPNKEVIINDIKDGIGYVLEYDNIIIGYFVLFDKKEPSYDEIDGSWISSNKYGTIHRLMIKDDYKGKEMALIILEFIEKTLIDNNVDYLRIDTHKDNVSMKKWIIKNGFSYCGIIYIRKNEMRLAYEKRVRR
ncbi:MAG: GNAT family N-acetyltransferase [Anaerorhabdus sp.]